MGRPCVPPCTWLDPRAEGALLSGRHRERGAAPSNTARFLAESEGPRIPDGSSTLGSFSSHSSIHGLADGQPGFLGLGTSRQWPPLLRQGAGLPWVIARLSWTPDVRGWDTGSQPFMRLRTGSTEVSPVSPLHTCCPRLCPSPRPSLFGPHRAPDPGCRLSPSGGSSVPRLAVSTLCGPGLHPGWSSSPALVHC